MIGVCECFYFSYEVGACIVSQDQIILSIGYNGFPRGCPDMELPWAKLSPSGNPLDTKYAVLVNIACLLLRHCCIISVTWQFARQQSSNNV